MSTEPENKKSLRLTAILIPDKEGGFTAFFAQFPEVIAEGDTEKEAMANLMNLLDVVFEYKQKEEMTSIQDSIGENFKTKSIELAIA